MAFASGVSSRELIRSKFEDGDVNILNIIKYKGGITKLVGESLQGNYIQEAQDTELTAKLSTLESYYRLNGGKFTELSQQKAYELILTELGQRVENQKIDDVKPDIEQPEEQETTANTGLDYNINLKDNPIEQNPNYVNSLLETVSEKRITELQRLQRNRTIANVAGTVVAGSLLVNLAAHAIKLDKPDIADTPDNLSVGTSPETATPNPTEISPVKPDIPSSEGAESMNEVAKEATQQLSTEQLQDISELSKGETLWGEIAKKLGANASEAQIQQGVETYMQSTQGSETIFNLANQTEGGRALLSQWGIDNAGELSQVSKTDLYELSRHLGVGQLKGLDTLDITNLPPLDEVSTPTGLTPPESPSSGVTPPGPGAESIPPTDTNTFAREVSHTLRLENTSLDDNQVKDILEAYHSTEQGRNSMYELILSAPEGDTYLSNLGIKTIEDFSNLSEDQLYELSQSIDLNKLEGFNFNNIILSRFEDAPNSIPLIKGTGALSQVNQYIDLYAGALPYNSTLGQEVLTTYLNTPEGKDWLYDAIVNNPDTLNGNQGIQIAKEYFRQKGIQQGTDIDWTLLSGDKKNPTSIFWRETSLTGGRKIPPLSTLLKPGTMPGIKKALEQVLTLKQ
jgi:hypothetical protein